MVFILSLLATPLTGADKEEAYGSTEKLKPWVGRNVDVDYRGCEPTGCVLVRGAPLKEVTDEAIIVIVNGAPFFIPKYMLKAVTLSK
jgi:hypothetical protein